MSWVFLNVGQCGNQVGHEIINNLWNSVQTMEEERWMYFDNTVDNRAKIHNKETIRCVCVDTEEKVVTSCAQKCADTKWKYDDSSMVFGYGGAGNNWSTGYAMCSGMLLQKSIESIRYQLESCDIANG